MNRFKINNLHSNIQYSSHRIHQPIVSLFFVLLLLFSACGIEQPTPHADLQAKVNDAKLVEILTEIHYAEAAYRMSEIKRDTFLQYSAEEMFKAIYEKHEVTRDDFLETIDYYTFYPEKFKEIYNQVEQNLEKR